MKLILITPNSASVYNSFDCFLCEIRENFVEAILLSQKSVQLSSGRIEALYNLTTLLIANNQWPEAEPHIRALLNKGEGKFLEKDWQAMLTLFKESIRTGKAQEVLAERWRPLREALAAAEGTSRYLNGVAPEVREPVLAILKDITPDVLPLQGNA